MGSSSRDEDLLLLMLSKKREEEILDPHPFKALGEKLRVSHLRRKLNHSFLKAYFRMMSVGFFVQFSLTLGAERHRQ